MSKGRFSAFGYGNVCVYMYYHAIGFYIIMELTNEAIRADIAGYQDRIQQAKNKLVGLPTSAGTWAARKQLESQRTTLADDIRRYRVLIGYAEAALIE